MRGYEAVIYSDMYLYKLCTSKVKKKVLEFRQYDLNIFDLWKWRDNHQHGGEFTGMLCSQVFLMLSLSKTL